jgi:hypothetical protein
LQLKTLPALRSLLLCQNSIHDVAARHEEDEVALTSLRPMDRVLCLPSFLALSFSVFFSPLLFHDCFDSCRSPFVTPTWYCCSNGGAASFTKLEFSASTGRKEGTEKIHRSQSNKKNKEHTQRSAT